MFQKNPWHHLADEKETIGMLPADPAALAVGLVGQCFVMPSAGFPGIKAPVESKHGVMVFPPFAKGHLQFTNEEMEMTYQVAQVRIHVERVIQRVKVFNILNSGVPTELISCMTDIVRMCCVLVNLQPPIIAK